MCGLIFCGTMMSWHLHSVVWTHPSHYIRRECILNIYIYSMLHLLTNRIFGFLACISPISSFGVYCPAALYHPMSYRGIFSLFFEDPLIVGTRNRSLAYCLLCVTYMDGILFFGSWQRRRSILAIQSPIWLVKAAETSDGWTP